jgi:hypothetical protein
MALHHVVVTIERNIHAVLEQQRLHVCDLISGIIHAVLCDCEIGVIALTCPALPSCSLRHFEDSAVLSDVP